jgi:hypothetical protein
MLHDLHLSKKSNDTIVDRAFIVLVNPKPFKIT